MCSVCGKRIIKNSNPQEMCDECYREHRKEWDREHKRNKREFKNSMMCPQLEIILRPLTPQGVGGFLYFYVKFKSLVFTIVFWILVRESWPH